MRHLPHEVEHRHLSLKIKIWEANDIAGYCLVDPILAEISNAHFLLADVTRLNFNVLYEIGYAMGKKKRVILVKNRSIRKDGESEKVERDLGLFDTIGFKEYQNAKDLGSYLSTISTVRPVTIPEKKKGNSEPFFIIWPHERTEAEVRLNSRIKKQLRASFRQFDPTENPRLSLMSAVDNVVNADGIILPLISANRRDAEVHNLRCAFVAGLADGLGKETLILQSGGEPVPLDYRDAVAFYAKLEDIDGHLAEFAPKVWERSLKVAQVSFPELKTPIQQLNLGHSNAENEHDQLSSYYIETEQFESVVRGEIHVVTGRKGSGKTALFYQVRNKIRSNKQNVVVDLNPDGFQLRKFKSLILDHLEDGTREHTITAFWEYLFFLEICYKLLEKDKKVHLHNHVLRPKYLALQQLYRNDSFIAEGDFAERLLMLVQAIEDKFAAKASTGDTSKVLTRAEITGFLYQHGIEKMRAALTDYLMEKGQLWILFDNIDKGWSAHGVDESDLLILRCLIEAFRKLERELRRSDVRCHSVVFVRNDIYELLINATPDRGKVSRASLDWTDPALLAEMLRRRFIYSRGMDPSSAPSFSPLWSSFAISHLKSGEETSGYILSRSLMRPRSLLDFLNYCKSHAVNLGHDKIEEVDVLEGELNYSTDLVNGISLEIQDVLPAVPDALFAFIESAPSLNFNELNTRLDRLTNVQAEKDTLLDLLFWYGFLGFLRNDLSDCFIFTVTYDMKKFRALLCNIVESNRIYLINPAFHKGLEVK